MIIVKILDQLWEDDNISEVVTFYLNNKDHPSYPGHILICEDEEYTKYLLVKYPQYLEFLSHDN